MPEFTITLTAKALTKLQAEVDRTNANNGTSLTVAQWIVLHLKEAAIANDLAAAVADLRTQAEQDAQATFESAAKAQRDRLLQEL